MIGRNQMDKKGHGRIYVFGTDEDVIRATGIIHRTEPEEENYYPGRVIARWDHEKPVELVPLHKWEPCMDRITLACARAGIPIWCISQSRHSPEFYEPEV